LATIKILSIQISFTGDIAYFLHNFLSAYSRLFIVLVSLSAHYFMIMSKIHNLYNECSFSWYVKRWTVCMYWQT